MNPKKRQQLAALKTASPLQMAGVLKEMELYDKKTAQEIIDEVYEKYATGQDLQEEVVEPVMLSVLDGLLENSKLGRQARKKGLTASRVISECRTFSYDRPSAYSFTNDGYVEFKNMREWRKVFSDKERTKWSRDVFEGPKKVAERNRFKEEIFNNENGKLTVDAITQKRNLSQFQNNPDLRRKDPKHHYQCVIDHIVPLKDLYNQLAGNCALSDNDIREIANNRDNWAPISMKMNSKKQDMSNGKFARIHGDGDVLDEVVNKINGTDGKEKLLNKEETKRMKQLGEKAQKIIDEKVNKEVFNTLRGEGSEDGKFAKVMGHVGDDALKQQWQYMTGNVILYIVKPLYYELSDIVKNGLKNGVGADSFKEALRIRFGRIKEYVVDNAKNFMGDSATDFLKGLVSSFIEGIIGLFVGIWRNLLKLCKECVKIISNAWKILKGEEGKKMTSAEKKQAIAKIVGTGVIAVAGIAFEEWLSAHIGREWSVVISTMMSGIAATLFFYFLNKADLFSVKAERRHARLEEIFNERIKEIETTEADMNTTALETMRQQREEFENVCDGIEKGLANDDIDKISAGWYRMADFLHVDLSFHNTDEFLDYTDKMLADSAAK